MYGIANQNIAIERKKVFDDLYFYHKVIPLKYLWDVNYFASSNPNRIVFKFKTFYFSFTI